MICKKCGNELKEEDYFCGNCGAANHNVDKENVRFYLVLISLFLILGIICHFIQGYIFYLNVSNSLIFSFIGFAFFVTAIILLLIGKRKNPGSTILSVLYWIIIGLICLLLVVSLVSLVSCLQKLGGI